MMLKTATGKGNTYYPFPNEHKKKLKSQQLHRNQNLITFAVNQEAKKAITGILKGC